MLIILLKVLLVILYAALGILLLTILIPIYIRFWADLQEEKKQINTTLSLYCGVLKFHAITELEFLRIYLVFFGIRIPVIKKALRDLSITSGKKPKKKETVKPKKKKASKLKAVDWINLLRDVFPRILKPISFKQFRCDIKVGFPNPAVTGMFIGMVSMFKFTLKGMEHIDISADFKHQGILGTINIEAKIHLIRYISTFLFIYKQYRLCIRNRKERKNG